MTLQAEKPRITLDEIQAKLDQSLDTRLATFAQSLDARFPKADPTTLVPLEAASGVLTPIERAIPKIGGLELGSVAIGGLGGLIAGELIDGFVPPLDKQGNTNMANLLVKAGGAWAFATMSKRLMSPTAANFAAGVLVLQLLRDVLPIDQWVDTVVSWTRPGQRQSQQAFGADTRVYANGNHAMASAYNQPSPIGIPSTDKLASMFG